MLFDNNLYCKYNISRYIHIVNQRYFQEKIMQQEQSPTIDNQNSLGNVQVSDGPSQTQNGNGQTPPPAPQPHPVGQAQVAPVQVSPVGIDAGSIVAGEIPRSDKWSAVEKAHLQQHPTCAACGLGHPKQGLQVHHMLPFHFCVKLGRPELELDERNLMTLCDETINNHHLLLGHLGNFQSYNPNVKADVAGPLGKLGDDQIDTDPTWQAEMRQRPHFLNQMSPQDIANFKQLMDTWYPPHENA